ncbi:hypothetical protein KI387_035557, partial [Taxus chinensis]
MATGLRAVAEEDGQLRLDTENGEEIKHVQSQVAIVLGSQTPEQPGTLYITTRRLIWLSDEDKQHGYGVDFLSISLHAVSRDPDAYTLPCIYAQIESTETDGSGDEELDDKNSANDGDLDLSQVTEIRLVPSDANTLDDLFKVLCACAELNPEPDGELEGEGDWIFGVEDMANAGLLAVQDGAEFEYDEENMANPIGYSNGLMHSLPANILE